VLVDSFRRGRVEDRARRRLAMPARELTDEDLERIEELVDAASGPAASALVEGLPEEQREAVLARVVDERDYAEIAAELEVSEAVVRQRVSRGLSTLRRPVRRWPASWPSSRPTWSMPRAGRATLTATFTDGSTATEKIEFDMP
jgi:DNA-directed RNA polymerase specialized sigma24 family protein